MKKISYLVLHLGFGGVEKAVINQANILSEKYQVEIISAYQLYDKPPFYIDPRISIVYLMKEKPNKKELIQAIKLKNPIKIIREGAQAIRVLIGRTRLMKKAVRGSDSDIIISSRYLYNKLLVKNARKGIITIAQEHRHHNNDKSYIKKLLKSVKNMDYFMPVSRELTEFYAKKLRNRKVRCVYIPHNIDYWPEKISSLTEKRIISVGRLSSEKGFLDLIEAMGPILNEYSNWSLHIIGDGDERDRIQQKICELGLEGQVILYGFKEKDFVNNMLQQSSIYVMASLEESFGIVLIEAQSFGLPCVAFDSAQGANEIIQDNKNGYLIPNRDKDYFNSCIKRLVDDIDLRISFGKNARIAAQIYKQDTIKEKWHSFINKIIKKEQKQ